ncbi:MAG: penicillin-binding protein 2 [Desulfobacteraceae bacterium]
MKNPDKEWLKKRVMPALICILLAFAVLFVRLLYLQLIEGEEYRRLSENNCIRLESVEASRGLIYDRNGALLVDNRPSFNLRIVLNDAMPVEKTLEKLAKCVDVPVEVFKEKICEKPGFSRYKPCLLKSDLSRDQLAVVEAHKFDLPGVSIDIQPRRNYIYKKRAAHIIGYLGEINKQELVSGRYPGVRSGDSIGRYGAEKVFESYLRGTRGGQQVEVDASGRLVRVIKRVESVPGKNIFLTLDNALQKKAESLLSDKAGAVVAIDPNNGDVLVMASAPSFDLNDFIGGISFEKWKALLNDPRRPITNKAIQGEYPPASTYKAVTAIAALEEGAVNRKTSWFCPGHYKYGNRVYRCWKKWGHGEMRLVSALEQSCDVYFYHAGEEVGVDALAQYARGCGLGRVTGIELDNERPGLIPTSSWKETRYHVPWQGGETLSLAIGQGFNLVTPLQMAVFIAAVGNDGTIYRPRILKSLQVPGKEPVEIREPEILGGLPAGIETLHLVKQGLFNVVQGDRGTARGIRLNTVDISGKTGTAQVFTIKNRDRDRKEKLAYHLRDHAWFVCYAPSEEPEIAVSVLIEHGEHGSTAAAPIAGEIIKTFMDKKKSN